MRYAETGYHLEVDLSRGTIEKVETDPRDTELYLGGVGSNAKILYERVPPEVDPSSPDNLLIFGSGLLCGTPVPGANRLVVSTISPYTKLHAYSIMGYYFGPELKFAGYDKIILRGKSPDLVYLWIHNDKVEIRDARHLHGKGAHETARRIKQELGDEKIQVAAIGLAGENRVAMSTIESGCGSASRGVGPVMGDKRLKAIAVRGTKDIQVARPTELFEECRKLMKDIFENPYLGEWMAFDENDEWHHNNFAWGNARIRIKNFWNKDLEERWRTWKYEHMDRQLSCYNCPKGCHTLISWPGRERYTYKCWTKNAYHFAAFEEIDFSFEFIGLAQEQGLDSWSTPLVIAFAIDLYDAGILTDQDLPEMPPVSDHRGRFYYLLDKIIHREGVGDLLANGTYWAARQIGKGAEAYEHNTVKKVEQVPIKLGKLNPIYFLMIATGEKCLITSIEGSFPQDPLPTWEERKAFVKDWVAVPDEKFKTYLLEWEKKSDISNERAAEICDWNETMHYIDDSLGICGFLSSFRGQFGGRPAYHIHNLPYITSLATGIELDETGLWRIARRNRTLVRAINSRLGLNRADDAPPANHWTFRDHQAEQRLLDTYYKVKGFNRNGCPTKETLKELDLGFVSEDLERRGIFAKEPVYPEDPLVVQARQIKTEVTTREELEQKGILRRAEGPPKVILGPAKEKRIAELRAREMATHVKKGRGY